MSPPPGLGSPRGLGSRSPGAQAGEHRKRCGARLPRTRYCDGSEQLKCQWPLLGGRVFSGLMSRRAVMGSSRMPGPGGLFDGKKGDARASRGMCAAWGVRVALWEGSGKGQLGTMWFWWEPPPWSLLPQQGGEIWGRLSGRQREPGWALGPFWCPHLALRCPSEGPAGLGEAAALVPWVSRFPRFCKGQKQRT